MKQFFGKYRGKVENNMDPMMLGRVQVSVPAVLGNGQMSWAMPCAPYGGKAVGIFAVPPVGANVWVEFEGGDPDYPICSGCFWGSGDAPASPATAFIKIWKTDGVTLKLDDTPGRGGLTIEITPPVVSTPMMLSFTSSGIEISHGAAKIQLTPTSVSINDGALEVV